MSIHSERIMINWVIATLTAGGLTVGDGIAPATVPAGSGYLVVYSITGGTTFGSLEAPREDATPTVQVTSTSVLAEQTRWLVDRARTVLAAAVPSTMADGRRVIWIDFPLASVSVRRDDNVQPARWYAPDRFEFGTTPT